jgi:S1-C subfamily serine protease
MRNPLSAVGLLYQDVAQPRLLGTCFAFRHRTRFLTAAHCVGRLAAEEIGIVLPNAISVGTYRVQSVARHPTADLAVLKVAEADLPSIDTFGYFGAHALGQGFMAYGFPEDVFGDTPLRPTERVFRGFIQRFMAHKSYQGYEYDALEMSIGAPAGLSGGPVFTPDAPWLIIGLVTENLRSTTFLQAVQEIQAGGAVYRESLHETINYGVALRLESQAEFLDQHRSS